jgi:FecR protein
VTPPKASPPRSDACLGIHLPFFQASYEIFNRDIQLLESKLTTLESDRSKILIEIFGLVFKLMSIRHNAHYFGPSVFHNSPRLAPADPNEVSPTLAALPGEKHREKTGQLDRTRSTLNGKATRPVSWRCHVPNHRSFLPLFLALIATLTLALAATPARATDNPTGYSYARIVRLSFVTGDVQIVRTDKSNRWEPAVLNMPVEQGFAVGTNNGRAEIEFEHGSTIWLAENSVLQFTELALSNGGRISRMTLSEGTATFQSSLASGDVFEVQAPSFKVAPSKSAEFRVNLRDEKDGAVSVFNGKVSVNGAAGAQEVPKGETFAMKRKSSEDALLKNTSGDEFDHWVSSRSTAQVSGATQSALYTNAPFSYGMADLSDYGAWNYFPGYGVGWQPSGIGAGWAPFMAGQWMDYPSLGWAWISSEPWGWVPYHFGGWNFDPAYGWMWFPGDYGAWTAAPVQFVGVGNRVGWMPRAGSTLRPGSVNTHVILGAKELGKGSKNRVYSASELGPRMQTLAFEPDEKGRPVAGAQPNAQRIIVPTAEDLGTLRATLAAKPNTKLTLNNAERDAVSPHSRGPEREFAPMNAGMQATRMPGHPPERAEFISRDEGGFSAERGAATASSQSVATSSMPASAAHPASAGSSGGGGKPH